MIGESMGVVSAVAAVRRRSYTHLAERLIIAYRMTGGTVPWDTPSIMVG
jgi:hypothetical protein